MILMVLLSAGLAAAPSSDPFAVDKVTLAGDQNPKVVLAWHLVRERQRRAAPAPSVPPPNEHDDAAETSGPVIRTDKGLLHCKGHWFPRTR